MLVWGLGFWFGVFWRGSAVAREGPMASGKGKVAEKKAKTEKVHI